MEINKDKPILVTRDESVEVEILRAFLVVGPIAYAGLLLYVHLTTAEVSAGSVALWFALSPVSVLLARYFPRKYLVLYDRYVFGGVALKKWVFVLSRKIPYEEITSVSLFKGRGPSTMLSIRAGWPSIRVFLRDKAVLRRNLKVLAEKVDPSVLDEDVREHLRSHSE